MFPYFRILGRVIGTYGVCMALGILLVGALAVRKSKRLGLPSEDVFIVGAFAIGFALVCGNLLYVFVSYPFSYILDCLRAGDLSIFGSGIVFYGGLIGGILGALLGTRVAKCSVSNMVKVIVPYIPLGHSLGRIGCTLAGCCHGKAYDGHFAIYYPNSVLGLPKDQGYFPVQPLEAAVNLVICAILLRLEKRVHRATSLLFVYLSLYAVIRFALEFLRGDPARGIYWGLSLSQWISLGLLLLSALYALMVTIQRKITRTPLT